MPGIIRRPFKIGVVYEDDDNERPYCGYCKKYNFELVKLYPHLLEDEGEEERQADYDKWYQCPKCNCKYRKHEVKHEGRIMDFVDLDDVDDSDGESMIGAVFKRGRKTRLQEYRERQGLFRVTINDPDAIAAIKKGLKVENYKEYQLGRDY